MILGRGAPPHFCRPGSPQGMRAASRPKGGEASGPTFPVGPPGRRALYTRERARPRSREGGAGETRCGKSRCDLTMNGGPDGPRWGKVSSGAGAVRPTGLPRCARPAPQGQGQRDGEQRRIGVEAARMALKPRQTGARRFWDFSLFGDVRT